MFLLVSADNKMAETWSSDTAELLILSARFCASWTDGTVSWTTSEDVVFACLAVCMAGSTLLDREAAESRELFSEVTACCASPCTGKWCKGRIESEGELYTVG